MAVTPGAHPAHHGELISRLRKIEGQVRGVQRMLEEDAYCVDVLNQISAVVAATEKVGLKVLEEHMRSCVAEALVSGQAEEKMAELTKVLERFLQVGRSPVAGEQGSTNVG